MIANPFRTTQNMIKFQLFCILGLFTHRIIVNEQKRFRVRLAATTGCRIHGGRLARVVVRNGRS